jgi:hypothetical protein
MACDREWAAPESGFPTSIGLAQERDRGVVAQGSGFQAIGPMDAQVIWCVQAKAGRENGGAQATLVQDVRASGP